MTTEERFSGLSLPASLLQSRPPRFSLFDQHGIRLDAEHDLDPRLDPVVFVHPRDSALLIRWGEQHASEILFDESIALRERQIFMQRGLMMQSLRLFRHRARFKRLNSLIQVLQPVTAFLAAEPSSYAATLAITPATYSPAAHAVGTGIMATALVAAGAGSGDVKPEALMAPLLAGLLADIGLVDSHRDLLSSKRAMTPPERAILQAHPYASSQLTNRIGLSNERLRSAVEHHHERIDGSGYPLGLGGDAIPLLARQLGLADAFTMLLANRPQFTALEPSAAIEAVSADGFDPALVDTLAQLIEVGAHDQPAATAA